MRRIDRLRSGKVAKEYAAHTLAWVDDLLEKSGLDFLGFQGRTELAPWAILGPSIRYDTPQAASIPAVHRENLTGVLKGISKWLDPGPRLDRFVWRELIGDKRK